VPAFSKRAMPAVSSWHLDNRIEIPARSTLGRHVGEHAGTTLGK